MKTASGLSDVRRRPTGIRTRCKRCNAAEGDVARFCGIVVCPINTGDLAIFRQIGRRAAKTAQSRKNGRLFSLGRFGGLVNVILDGRGVAVRVFAASVEQGGVLRADGQRLAGFNGVQI